MILYLLLVVFLGEEQFASGLSILTSDVGGTNESITICSNQLVTLSCTTSSNALVWFYPEGQVIYSSESNVNESSNDTIMGGGLLKFRLVSKIGNYTSIVSVNTTTNIIIKCSSDGTLNTISAINITIKDVLPAPSIINVTNVQKNSISLQWTQVSKADSYEILIEPPPIDGECENGTCIFYDNFATIGHLQYARYSFKITSVSCGISGSDYVSVIEDTIPKARITSLEVNFDENETLIICPNDIVTISCQTKLALVWLDTASGKVLKYYDNSSITGTAEKIKGFNVSLVEKGKENFTSEVLTMTNYSFSVTCSPTGDANDFENNAIASIIVLDILPQPEELQVTDFCLDFIDIQWNYNENVDNYSVVIHPCVDKELCNELDIDCDNDTCTTRIYSVEESIEYSISVSNINCAGNSPSNTISTTIIPETLSKPKNLEITKKFENDSYAGFSLEWEQPVVTCKTPRIDNYTIRIYSNGGKVEFISAQCCMYFITLERCGVYSISVTAINRLGTEQYTSEQLLSTGALSQSVSVSRITHDSVLLTATVANCISSSVVAITMELSKLTHEQIKQENFTYYPNLSFANLTVTDLDHDTEYNITVTIYYHGFNRINSLSPQKFSFMTPQNFFTLQNIAIGSLTAGTFVGIVVIIIILLVGIICIREIRHKRQSRNLRRRQDTIRAKQEEIEKEIGDIQMTAARIPNPSTFQPNIQSNIKPTQQLYPQLETNNSTYM